MAHDDIRDLPGHAYPGMGYSDLPPPPPVISSEGIIATDITQRFKSAAASLKPGDLIKDGTFTLFEAVGALEIMDPKMDSGCLAPGESLDDEYDFTRQLLPSEVLGIIDRLLCLEMAWHLGYPLSQTLLTSVYIEAILMPTPNNIQEAHFIRDPDSMAAQDPMAMVLRAYCLGLLKACWYVNERIKNEHYYEEEDFVTNTYHRSFLDNIDRGEIREEVNKAKRLVHALRTELTPVVADALSFRLELRTAFLRAIELSELRTNPDSLSLPWSQMQAVWGPISRSRHLGTPVPEAFSTKIQRRLASTVPPRPIVQPSFEETDEHFQRLFRDAIDVLEVLNYSDSQSLLNFVLTFQARKPQPLVYIRTMLQNFLFRDMVILGRLSIRHVMDDDLSILVLPCSPALDPANDNIEPPHHRFFTIAQNMETFRQRAAHSYLDIFRALCQNRCRVRRTLCHMIQDWEQVQMQAEETDEMIQICLNEQPMVYPPGTPPSYSLALSSWAYLYKLQLMEWIVQLGFELETYQPDELAGMYWYLGELVRTRFDHVGRIQAFSAKRIADLRADDEDLMTPAMEAKHARSCRYLRATRIDASITGQLSEALTCLYLALDRLGLVVPPPRPYSTDELRYDIRMKPFAAVGIPALPSYEEFAAHTTKREATVVHLLTVAFTQAEAAKQGHGLLAKMSPQETFSVGAFEHWAARNRQRLQSVVATAQAADLLRKVVEELVSEGSVLGLGFDEARAWLGERVRQAVRVTVPKPDKCHHDWWVVPQLDKIDST